MTRATLGLAAALLCAAACGDDDVPRPPREDCDPGDVNVWRRDQAYVDRDRDGVGGGALVEVCIGRELPVGYVRTGGDCDDDNALFVHEREAYRDDDGDGVGAGSLAAVCAGAALPPRWAAVSGDCAPDDAQRWQLLDHGFRDSDGDMVTVPAAGQVCSGTALPPGYASVASGNDCADDDASRWLERELYVDGDRDHVGDGAAVARCIGATVPDGYAAVTGDCAADDGQRWQILSYGYRDADGDGHTVAQAGQLCTGAALPAGYLVMAVGNDCADNDGDAWMLIERYADSDRDNVGAGALVPLCIGASVPVGYATVTGDCAADDRDRWQLLTYGFRDRDGDTYTVAESGEVCTGVALPPGYLATAHGADCADGDPAVFTLLPTYADTDDDGVGAGPVVQACTDGSVPDGFSMQFGDCAPDDRLAWQLRGYQHVDRDGDGHTTPEAGSVCSGAALPDPFRTAASGNDCADGDRDRWRFLVLYPDGDGDGVGVPPYQIPCLGPTIPDGLTRGGYDVDDDNRDVIEDEDEDLLVDIIQS